MTSSSTADIGLEDITVVSSSICTIDGQRGTLSYWGYDIADLAENATFEEVAYLLWNGNLPNTAQLTELRQQLGQQGALPSEVVDALKALPKDANAMAVLRTAVSTLALYDPDGNDASVATGQRTSVRLTAQIGTIVAHWQRIRAGQDIVQPDPQLPLAGNFLYMLSGKRPGKEDERAFDIALILHADHELNASTFSARVTAATLSDVYSTITSAIGTLKGPLHGGANEQVMNTLEAVGHKERAGEYIHAALERHERFMGFGHRVYKTGDPRATILKRLSEEAASRSGEPKWFEISLAVEEAVREERQLNANVDFYSASLYRSLGIPTDLFTPVFAVSRITGWTAHVLEQYRNNRLIRPRAEYIGPTDRKYVPIEQR